MTHSLISADISIFSQEISNSCYIKKYRYRLHFNTWFQVLTFFWICKGSFLINMVAILMILAKLATLDLLKIKIFWNKGYNVIISLYDVSRKFYHVIQIITRKTDIFEGCFWFKFNSLGLANSYRFEILHQCGKRVKDTHREKAP